MSPREATVTVLLDLAEAFLVYASDQLACQRYAKRPAERADLRRKADVWTEAAKELSERAEALLAEPSPQPEADDTIAALEAFVEAGGANPRLGKMQFSVWSLDKLGVAYAKAVAALGRLDPPQA